MWWTACGPVPESGRRLRAARSRRPLEACREGFLDADAKEGRLDGADDPVRRRRANGRRYGDMAGEGAAVHASALVPLGFARAVVRGGAGLAGGRAVIAVGILAMAVMNVRMPRRLRHSASCCRHLSGRIGIAPADARRREGEGGDENHQSAKCLQHRMNDKRDLGHGKAGCFARPENRGGQGLPQTVDGV